MFIALNIRLNDYAILITLKNYVPCLTILTIADPRPFKQLMDTKILG